MARAHWHSTLRGPVWPPASASRAAPPGCSRSWRRPDHLHPLHRVPAPYVQHARYGAGAREAHAPLAGRRVMPSTSPSVGQHMSESGPRSAITPLLSAPGLAPTGRVSQGLGSRPTTVGAAGSAPSGVDACRCAAPKPGMQSRVAYCMDCLYSRACEVAMRPSLPGGGLLLVQRPRMIRR